MKKKLNIKKASGKILKLLFSIMMVFSLFLVTDGTRNVSAESVNVSIVLKDDVTNDPIPGVTFDFYKVNLLDGTQTLIGTAQTDADGIAAVTGDSVGKYVAKYKSGLDDSIYDIDYTKDADYEITVTSDDSPGVQLRERWSQEFGNFTFRDIISDGDYAVVSGKANSLPLAMPGNMFEDGQPRNLVAGSQGVGMKINRKTGKIAWITQFAANYASYSVTKVGDSYIFSNYNSPNVVKISNNGTPTIIPVEGLGGLNRSFDIRATNDGGFAYLGDGDKIIKYDADGNKVYTSGPLGFSTTLKSIYPTSDGNYLVSGGYNDDHGALVAKVSVAADGTPNVIWQHNLTKGVWGARFNDCAEVSEGGKTYYMASGNIAGNGASSVTIPGTETFDGNPITVKTSSTLYETAALAKLDENGKFVWVSTFATNATGGESQFNSLAINADSLGGYSVAGQTAGTVHLDADQTTMGAAMNIISSSTTTSDAIIARFDNNGRFVDSYLYGSDNKNDEYYGIATYDTQILAVGADANKNVVCLDLTITTPPRVVVTRHEPQYIVEYYGQNPNDDNYSLLDSVTKYGDANDDAVIDAKTFTGYTLDNTKTTYEALGTAPSTTPIKIVDDGTLKIKLYYDALEYTIKYDTNGGQGDISDSGSHRFNSTVQVSSAIPTKDGYVFKGWKIGNAGTYQSGATFTINSSIANTANANGVITLKAVWLKETVANKKTNNKSNVDTGDHTDVEMYTIGLFASLAILLATIYAKNKKQRD